MQHADSDQLRGEGPTRSRSIQKYSEAAAELAEIPHAPYVPHVPHVIPLSSVPWPELVAQLPAMLETRQTTRGTNTFKGLSPKPSKMPCEKAEKTSVPEVQARSALRVASAYQLRARTARTLHHVSQKDGHR